MDSQELIFIGLKRVVLAIRNQSGCYFYCGAYCFVCEILDWGDHPTSGKMLGPN
jgi:hypothetical protein